MNIVQAGNNYSIKGGSDRVMLETMSLLEEHGNLVIPFVPNKPDNLRTKWSQYFPDNFDNTKAGIKDVPRFLYSTSAKEQIVRLIKNEKIDLVHLHIYNGGLTPSILEPLNKNSIPVVQSLHEYRLACPVYTMVSNNQVCEDCKGHSFYRAIPKKCNKSSLTKTAVSVLESYYARYLGAVSRVDHFIAVSEFMKNKMLQYNIATDKISTIHNFVDTKNFTPKTDAGDYFLYFGRVEKLKGIETLVKASAKVPEVPLYIVGEGNYVEELQNYIEEHHLEHIKVLPFAHGDELKSLVRNSLCTVLPSEWYENCPMTILESFAMGKPVIGTKIGGIPELIDDEKDGFIVNVGDCDELSEKLRFFAQNKGAASKFGQNGLEKVKIKFSPHEYYAKLIKLYKSLS